MRQLKIYNLSPTTNTFLLYAAILVEMKDDDLPLSVLTENCTLRCKESLMNI